MIKHPLNPILTRNIPALLEINNQFSKEICEDNQESFTATLAGACWAFHLDELGFMWAFNQETPITGYNIDWLKSRLDHFLYVDRIAISTAAQGLGLGRQLYEALISYGSEEGYPAIVCEINVNPPNPGSVSFHERLEFKAFDLPRTLPNGKTVQYFRYEL